MFGGTGSVMMNQALNVATAMTTDATMITSRTVTGIRASVSRSMLRPPESCRLAVSSSHTAGLAIHIAKPPSTITGRAGFTRGAFYSNFETKEELFAELLQDRVYRQYADLARDSATPERPTLREVGEQLAAIQASADGRWLFQLWLELLAHAGRDERFRQIAAGFWSANRRLTTQAIESTGRTAPVPADHLASAMIALDIGLALQHFVDPDAVPLTLYPELYALLLERS